MSAAPTVKAALDIACVCVVRCRELLKRYAEPPVYFERARIFLRLRWRRRVRFFFHFQRIFEVAFFHGLDL